jgi:hypothetical protein
LLFLDPAHSVEPFLDADILLKCLLTSLPDRQAKAEPTGEPGPRRPIAELHDQ